MGNSTTSLPVEILAGGLATRLRPITETIPKALVEVAGEPFLNHQLRLLRDADLTQIVLCVGHLGEMVEAQVGDGEEFGVQIEYSFDGDTLLGTGGALRKALSLLGDRFLVLYGDSYLPIDYQAVCRAFLDSGKSGLMTVYRNEEKWDSSNVVFENGEIKNYDKESHDPSMKHIDYGLSAMEASVIASIPDNEKVDLAEVLRNLVASKELAGYEVDHRFYEIGSPSGLQELDSFLSNL